MTKFVFTGDPKNKDSNPSSISFSGQEFPMNTPVDVEDPNLIRKLEGNSHFKRADEASREEKSGHPAPQTTARTGR